MGRVFRRGELKQAVLIVLESAGEAHGYGIMGLLKERVGGGWKPSPGAIYPAILALVEEGLVVANERDGTTVYSLTAEGRRMAKTSSLAGRWASLNARAESGEERYSVGSLLDAFAAESGLRRRLARSEQKQEIESILARAGEEIEKAIKQGEGDG